MIAWRSGRRGRAARVSLGAAGLLLGAAALAVPLAPPADAAAQQPATVGPNDQFGVSVAVSGPTAVIGASALDKDSGAAYVYVRSGTAWRRQATLTDPARGENDLFGSSVAVSSTATGTIAVIGAPGAGANGAGLAYVYVRTGKTWHRQAALAGPNGQSEDNFGASVAVSGTTVVVGAYGVNKTRGAVYMFARSGGTWRLRAAFDDPSGHFSDDFGWSVAVSGVTAVVGDPGRELSSSEHAAGAAFVYVRSGTAWHRQAAFYDPGHTGADSFGGSVSLSGATAVIGAGGTRNGQGAAYLYQRSGTAWHRIARLGAPHPTNFSGFGDSVAVSGIRALIGDPLALLTLCGTAFEFTRPAKGTWHERARLVNPGCASGDDFGASVALSATTAVIGAPGKHSAYEQTLP
jgi:FG-GAP repeat